MTETQNQAPGIDQPCLHCGGLIKRGAAICKHCREQITPAPALPRAESAATPSAQPLSTLSADQRRSPLEGRRGWVIVGVLVVAIGGYAAVQMRTQGRELGVVVAKQPAMPADRARCGAFIEFQNGRRWCDVERGTPSGCETAVLGTQTLLEQLRSGMGVLRTATPNGEQDPEFKRLSLKESCAENELATYKAALAKGFNHWYPNGAPRN